MKLLLTLAALIALAGCAASPMRRIYVLNAPVQPVAGVYSEAGRPVVAVPTVAVPDYLDSTDILLRNGRNELTPSETGRWGERLSLGITNALEATLGRRLPADLVTHTPMSSGQPNRNVLVNVDAFDVRPDGTCVLSARWTIEAKDQPTPPVAERGTFVTKAAVPAVTETSGPPVDAAIVAAMASAIDQLADRIAAEIQRGSSRVR